MEEIYNLIRHYAEKGLNISMGETAVRWAEAIRKLADADKQLAMAEGIRDSTRREGRRPRLATDRSD